MDLLGGAGSGGAIMCSRDIHQIKQRIIPSEQDKAISLF
jgi:hypothetical protein